MDLCCSQSLLIGDLLVYKLVEVDHSSDELLHLEHGQTFSGMLQDQAIRESCELGSYIFFRLITLLPVCCNTYFMNCGFYMVGTAVAQWLRCCATNCKFAGSIPDGVIGIFH